MKRKYTTNYFCLKNACLTSAHQKGSILGMVKSSLETILQHKMRHSLFFNKPLISLISVRFPQVPTRGSEQPLSPAEVGTHG